MSPVASWACGVAAVGTVRVPFEGIAALRTTPGPTPKPLPNQFLKHADEQTVAGLSALFQAFAAMPSRSFEGWAVLGVPRHLGRLNLAAAIDKSIRDGSVGASPHIIPHQSLHAVSGAMSVALGLHGPNFGIGGGLGNVAEGLLTALSLMDEGRYPGAWLLLTECDPELAPDATGRNVAASVVHAVALAVQPAVDVRCERILWLERDEATDEVATVSGMIDGLKAGRWSCAVPGVGRVQLAEAVIRAAA